MTWGYVEGLKKDPKMFPDYLIMQKRISDGYEAAAKMLKENGTDAEIIPVGLAFQKVYEDIVAKGEDPLAKGSRFRKLYKWGKNYHLTLAGSYLAASVSAASLSGMEVKDVEWAPKNLSPEFAAYLRTVADRTLLDLKK